MAAMDTQLFCVFHLDSSMVRHSMRPLELMVTAVRDMHSSNQLP